MIDPRRIPDDGDSSRTLGALRECEEVFNLLVANVVDYALVILDDEGVVRSWNVGAERIFKYEAAEIVGRHVAVLYTTDEAELGVPAHGLAAAITDGRFESTGWRVRRDGSRFLAQSVLEVLRADDGTVRGYGLIFRDYSAREQLEERFRRVVEAAPSAMVMVNAEGRIAMVNLQAEGMFGYTRSELLGQPVDILVPQRFREHHPGLRSGFFADPKSRPMGAGRDLYALKKDGSEFAVEIGLNPIVTDEGPMVLSAIVDISARKSLEERFRLVVESAPNAMVMVNSKGRIEMINVQAERVFGYQRSELLGQPVEILVPERFRGHHPSLRGGFFSDPKSRPMGAGRDLYAMRKDGSEFAVEIGLNPIKTEEGPMVLSAIVDISDRKGKEARIEAALKEKDVLLGEIHHRVKNNLQIVHSLLDLQSSRIVDPLVLEMLRETQNRVQSMALIHQTLYQSRDFSGVDFGNFLDNLAPILSASYGVDSTRIALSIDAVGVLLPLSVAIPCGLIVNELVTNSLKHGFPGNRYGHISINLSKDGDDYVRLVVSDDGIGIAESVDFENTTSLGLKLVTLLSEQVAGELKVNRANPTEFVLRFPVANAN